MQVTNAIVTSSRSTGLASNVSTSSAVITSTSLSAVAVIQLHRVSTRTPTNPPPSDTAPYGLWKVFSTL